MIKTVQSKKSPSISIIIPTYNASIYVDTCLSCILTQSFDDFEVILVDDASVDNTPNICKTYQMKDNRIKYFEKKHEGQGVARNYAIKKALGEYLCFLDVDDKISKDYLKNLYEEAKLSEADVVLCDYVEVNEISNISINRSQKLDSKNKDLLIDISCAFWAKLWKKSFYLEQNIEQPDFYFEDVATVPYLICKANKISYTLGSKYYYYRRNGSTVTSSTSFDDRQRALWHLYNLFVEKSCLEEFKEQLKSFFFMRYKADITMAKYFLEKEYEKRVYEGSLLLKQVYNIEPKLEKKIFVCGSYNLYRSIKYMENIIIEHRFMSTSIISIVGKCIEKINEYPLQRDILLRRENVINDCTKKLIHMNACECTQDDLFVFDLLDERFDVAFENNGNITLSDAYLEDSGAYIPIEILSMEERYNLWEDASGKFINKIKNLAQGKPIVMVRMLLAEEYGTECNRQRYDNLSEIKKANELLNYYYDDLIKKYPQIVEVRLDKIKNLYTDKEFRYGCYPWHLNEVAYKNIGMLIQWSVYGR